MSGTVRLSLIKSEILIRRTSVGRRESLCRHDREPGSDDLRQSLEKPGNFLHVKIVMDGYLSEKRKWHIF